MHAIRDNFPHLLLMQAPARIQQREGWVQHGLAMM